MSTFSSFAGDGGDTLGFGSRSAGAEEKIEVLTIKEEEEEAAADAAAGATAVVDGGGRGMELPGATRDWSSLPKPAILLVLMGLRPSLVDAFSFAGVCEEWRSVYVDCRRELLSSMPPLIVNTDHTYYFTSGSFFSIFDHGFFSWQTSQLEGGGSRTTGSLCGLDWYLIGVSHGYLVIRPYIFWVDSERMPILLLDPLFPESHIELPPAAHFKYGIFSRALMTAPPTSPGCVVVMTGTNGFWYCRPGDTDWVRCDFSHKLSEDYCYHDLCHVAVLGRRLYALTSYGEKVLVVELLFPRPSVAVVDVEGLHYQYIEFYHFVESAGEILYIADDREHRVTVWRLDLPARRWVTLDTLGKRSIFLPQYKKFEGWLGTPLTCVGAAEWGGREDCIYYMDCIASSAVVVWSMKDGSVEHHPLAFSDERHFWEWWVPSFCYAQKSL